MNAAGPTVEPLGRIDIADLVRWITPIQPQDWPGMADPAWHGANRRCLPLAESLLAHFPGCALSGVGLFLLAAGQEHPMHTDVQPPDWVTRVHVPIVTNEHATVSTDEGTFHMQSGVAYRFNTRRNHAVRNGGEQHRVHLVFDVRKKAA